MRGVVVREGGGEHRPGEKEGRLLGEDAQGTGRGGLALQIAVFWTLVELFLKHWSIIKRSRIDLLQSSHPQSVARKADSLHPLYSNTVKQNKGLVLWRYSSIGPCHSAFHTEFKEWKEKMSAKASE